MVITFLGAYLGESLNIKAHIANRAKNALFNLYLIKNIRKYITQETAKMLLCSLVLSQLDYLNLLKFLFKLLKFKLLTIVFKTLLGNGPSYLQTKLNTMTYHRTTRRSTTKGITWKAPFNKKKTQGDRGFTYTAVTHWNKLPEYIRQTEDISTFKRLLKTHYFKLAYKTQTLQVQHIFFSLLLLAQLKAFSCAIPIGMV